MWSRLDAARTTFQSADQRAHRDFVEPTQRRRLDAAPARARVTVRPRGARMPAHPTAARRRRERSASACSVRPPYATQVLAASARADRPSRRRRSRGSRGACTSSTAEPEYSERPALRARRLRPAQVADRQPATAGRVAIARHDRQGSSVGPPSGRPSSSPSDPQAAPRVAPVWVACDPGTRRLLPNCDRDCREVPQIGGFRSRSFAALRRRFSCTSRLFGLLRPRPYEWRRRESNPRPRSRGGGVYERIRRSDLIFESPRRRGFRRPAP